jgi:hypothetical protein
MVAQLSAPMTPVSRQRVMSIDESILQMDQERRARRECIKRTVFNENKKRVQQSEPGLVEEDDSNKRQCLGLFLEDTWQDKENNNDFFNRQSPRVDFRSSEPLSQRSPLALRPRNLNFDLHSTVHDRSASYESLPYMPLSILLLLIILQKELYQRLNEITMPRA